MSWRSKSSPKSHSVNQWDWTFSSGDEQSSAHGHPQKASGQAPATTSNEAIWRAAKRISSTFRWLKLDLMMLAQNEEYEELVQSVAEPLRLIGKILLPDLGSRPLEPSLIQRPEVVDLVATIGSIPDRRLLKRDVGIHADIHSDIESAGCYSQGVDCRRTVGTQTSLANCTSVAMQTTGDYMVRHSTLVGEWVPLRPSSLRVGSVLKCVVPVQTSNADCNNVYIAEKSLAKVVSKDEDGDIKIVLLSDANQHDLWYASERHWLLQGAFHSFVSWLPSAAVEAMKQKSCEREDIEEDTKSLGYDSADDGEISFPS